MAIALITGSKRSSSGKARSLLFVRGWHCAMACLLTILAATSEASPAAASPDPLILFDLLSKDLRQTRLLPAERAELAARVANGAPTDKVYDDLIDRWLTRDALLRSLDWALPVKTSGQSIQNIFHRRLFRPVLSFVDAESARVIYYINRYSAPRCTTAEAIRVHAWWSREPVWVCPSSYRPEHTFGRSYFCGIGDEANDYCGCGPWMVNCLPADPPKDLPELAAKLSQSIDEEVTATAADVVINDRSFDELLLATRTWQSGLTQFMYLRREILKAAKSGTPAKEVEERFARYLQDIDLNAAPAWAERRDVYRQSGLFLTPIAASFDTHRNAVIRLFRQYLCVDYATPARVDRDSLLATTEKNHAGIRFRVLDSPMRAQAGCKGCHAPMDNTAGFMDGLETAQFASAPTGRAPHAQFYLLGANDFRGQGVGIGALNSLVVRQPEFSPCVASRAFRHLLHRDPTVAEQGSVIGVLASEFDASRRSWRQLLRSVLKNTVYRGQALTWNNTPAETRSADVEVEKSISAAAAEMTVSCAGCHGESSLLDLRAAPSAHSAETWSLILQKLQSGEMPPPDKQKGVVGRFPLDPERRRRLIQSVSTVLGRHADMPREPRILSVRVWSDLVTRIAGDRLTRARLEALLRPAMLATPSPNGLDRAPSALYLSLLQQAAMDVCKALQGEAPSRQSWPGEIRAEVRRMHIILHDGEPSAADTSSYSALADRIFRMTKSAAEAQIGVCASILSSPKLLYQGYAAR